jgi:hypothetical protein
VTTRSAAIEANAASASARKIEVRRNFGAPGVMRRQPASRGESRARRRAATRYRALDAFALGDSSFDLFK